jgi:pyruvoyl-dependent arginine decarboxylase (PvlArgDC)
MTDAAGIVCWQDGDEWLGYLEEYPDYWTQGQTLDELVENLRELEGDLRSGAVPADRPRSELRPVHRKGVWSAACKRKGGG